MVWPAKLALTSVILNVLSLLVYTLAVSDAAFQEFTLATTILAVVGIVNLTVSILAVAQLHQYKKDRHRRQLVWVSLAIAIGMILVIGILLLNIWVFNFRFGT